VYVFESKNIECNQASCVTFIQLIVTNLPKIVGIYVVYAAEIRLDPLSAWKDGNLINWHQLCLFITEPLNMNCYSRLLLDSAVLY